MDTNKENKDKIKIVLADDYRIVRTGLRVILEKNGDIEVMAEVSNGREAVEAVLNLSPDAAVFDISMPDLNGIEATRQIRAESPEVKVIALSMHSEQRFIAGMLEAGASAYLLKTCSSEELISAIHCVVNNQSYLSPDIAHIIIKDYVSGGHSEFAVSPLTVREREVLLDLRPGISPGTQFHP